MEKRERERKIFLFSRQLYFDNFNFCQFHILLLISSMALMLWKRAHAGVTGRVCDSLADRQVFSHSRLKLFLPDECWLLHWGCDGWVMINNFCWLGWRLPQLVFLVVKQELEPECLGESCCVFTLLPRSLFQNRVSVAGSAANTLLCEHISHLISQNRDYVDSLQVLYCTLEGTLTWKSITAFQKYLIIADKFYLPLVCSIMTYSSLKLRTFEVFTGQTQSLQCFASHFCYWM